MSLSEAQLNANRANAQHSPGPTSETGKAKSSLNALKTGLTGQTVLLPTEDPVVYQAFLESLFTQYSPVTDQENRLVQTIADTEWRLARIPSLEAGIFAVAHLEQDHLFLGETDQPKRDFLINAKIQMLYEKPLKNLALQERRLRNQCKADTEKLEQLQKQRVDEQKRAEQDAIDQRKAIFERACNIANKCVQYKKDFEPAAFGFEFSADEYEHYWEVQEAQFKFTEEFLDFHQVIADYRKQQNVNSAVSHWFDQ